MKLHVHPPVALCDQKLDISVSELPAHGKVKISASMSLPWAKSVGFESFAWFTADAQGQVDCARQKPDSGTYDFVDSMGLIVSLKCKNPKALEKIGQGISVNDSLFIDMVAESEGERTSARLERLFKGPEIKSLRISDEFVGELFYAENPGRQIIVFLGGSGSGLSVNSPVAALLASHGFNVLSVPFFNEKSLPAELSEIPLEYFERVFGWLSKNPLTAGKEIQLLGWSKGGELALLLAARYPFITKVAAFAPHAYCFQGLAFKNVSSWTYQGKQLPFIRLKNRWVFGSMIMGVVKNEPFQFTTTYRKGLAVAQNKEAARIKIDEANADLLLFAGRQCGMWNTYDGCVEIIDTLRKCHYPHAYDLVVYEEAGEPYCIPYVIPPGESKAPMGPRLVLSMGGTLRGNAQAQADYLERAIAFFGQAKESGNGL